MKNEKSDSMTGPTGNDEPTTSTSSKIEPLQLPLGAFIAYRMSSGAKTSSREIVVYPDGRVSFGGPDLAKQIYSRAGRKLNDGQMARMRKMLDQVNFFRATSAQGKPPPNGFVYEIIARIGNRSNHVECFDSSIPDALEPLIHTLNTLMPKE